jgi:NlpC/P60 family putative phage cell wall peptidase
MTSREAIVAEARRWIGTPYRHQASTIGAGADCLGLVRGIWRNLFQAEPEAIPPYTPDWSEPTREEALLFAAQRHLLPKPLDSHQIGEVILFRMSAAGVAKHLGISAERDGAPTVIHSYTGHGVVESFLTLPWQQKIVARFDFPQGAK